MGTIMISTIKGRKSKKGYLCFTFLLLVVAISAVRQVGIAGASTITVNTFADELNVNGNCSLREAIQSANQKKDVDACPAGSGDDVIILPTGTYELTIAGADENENATGDLDLFTANPSGEILTIQGAGAGNTFIDGGGLDRVFHVVSQLSQLRLIDVTVQNGQLTDRGGAGVLIWGTLYLENVVVRNNTINGTTSDAVGGGLCVGCNANNDTSQATIVNTIIENNTASRGGGIFSNQPMTVTTSSIINNSALAGGGIVNYGALTLTNSTLSGNSASNAAGAIYQASGTVNMLNCTLSHNTIPIVGRAGGIGVFGGTGELKNTIVANNTDVNCSGSLISQGHNVSSDSTCSASFTASGDLNNTDPLLGPLQNNGGPTPTYAPPIDSPAIDAGEGCPATDQRGVARPQGNACDIGAFELLFWRVFLPLVLRSL